MNYSIIFTEISFSPETSNYQHKQTKIKFHEPENGDKFCQIDI